MLVLPEGIIGLIYDDWTLWHGWILYSNKQGTANNKNMDDFLHGACKTYLFGGFVPIVLGGSSHLVSGL